MSRLGHCGETIGSLGSEHGQVDRFRGRFRARGPGRVEAGQPEHVVNQAACPLELRVDALEGRLVPRRIAVPCKSQRSLGFDHGEGGSQLMGSVRGEFEVALALSLDRQGHAAPDGHGTQEDHDQQRTADPDLGHDERRLGRRYGVHRLTDDNPAGRRRRSCQTVNGSVDRDRRRRARIRIRRGKIQIRQTLRLDGSVGSDIPDKHRQPARILAGRVEALLVGRPSAWALAHVGHLGESLLQVAVHFGREIVRDGDRHHGGDQQIRDADDRTGGERNADRKHPDGRAGRPLAPHASSRR